MARSVEVEPSFREVALRLKAADVELWKATQKNIRVATAPARPAVRAFARATLPKRGGLNEWVASAAVTTSILTGARTAGVAVRVKKRGHDMKDLDQTGVVRHPVFKSPRNPNPPWVSQQTNAAGFATRPLMALRPAVSVACYEAMRQAAAVAGFK